MEGGSHQEKIRETSGNLGNVSTESVSGMTTDDYFKMLMKASKNIEAVKKEHPYISKSEVVEVMTGENTSDQFATETLNNKRQTIKSIIDKNEAKSTYEKSNLGILISSIKNFPKNAMQFIRNGFSLDPKEIDESNQIPILKMNKVTHDTEEFAHLPITKAIKANESTKPGALSPEDQTPKVPMVPINFGSVDSSALNVFEQRSIETQPMKDVIEGA
jgi:hypothetical protein